MPALKALSRGGAACLLALAALSLSSCSTSDPGSPAQDQVGDTYVRATVTILDTGSPCTNFSCEPEFYECRGRDPILAGQQWLIRANSATAGAVSDTQWAITGTDTARLTSIALEMQLIDVTPGPPTPKFTYDTTSGNSDSNWVDLDTQCDQVGAAGPESRLHLVDGSTASTLNITAMSFDGTRFVPAVPDGSGGFSPASIMEGTFSFIGRVVQPTPTGSVSADALVEGCFRVNLPSPERGVPVAASPSSAACN